MHMMKCDGCGVVVQTDRWERPKGWKGAEGVGDLCQKCSRTIKAAIKVAVLKLRKR